MKDGRRSLYALLASSAGIQGAGLIVTLFLGIILARFLGPAQYGVYGLAMSVVSIAGVVGQFGFPVLATREAAHALETDTIDPRRVTRWFVVKSMLIGLGAGTAVYFGLTLYPPYWAVGHWGIMAGCAALVWASSMLPVTAALLRGFGANLGGQAIELLIKPMFAVAVAYAVASGGYFAVDVALGAQILATVAAIFISQVLIRAALRKKITELSLPYQPKAWGSTGLALMSNALLGALNGNFPILIAGIFIRGEDLGAFRVALSLAAILGLPSAVANIAVGPIVARETARGNEQALNSAISHSTLASLGLTVVGFGLVAIFGRWAIPLLFGEGYDGAYRPLLILGLAQVIVAAFGISATFLNMTNQHRVVMKAFLVSVPIGVMSALLLTPLWGIDGAAAGSVIMVSAWHCWVFLPRHAVAAPLPIWRAIPILAEELATKRGRTPDA